MADPVRAGQLYQMTFLNFLGLYLLIPLIPVYLATVTDDAATIGLIISSTSILPLLLGYPVGIRIERFSPRGWGMLSTFGMIIAAVTLAFGRHLIFAAVSQMIQGASQLVMSLTLQTTLHNVGDEPLEATYGRYTFWASAGQIASPVLGGVIVGFLAYRGVTAHIAYRAVFALAGLVFLGALLVASRFERTENRVRRDVPAPPSAHARETRGALGAVLMAGMALVFASDLRRSFYPLYLSSLGFSPTRVGMLYSTIAFASAGVRPFLGSISRWLPSQRLLVAILMCGAMGWMLTPLLHHWTLLAMAATICGISLGIGHPLTMSIVASSGRHAVGQSLGLRQVFNQLGQFLSPLLLGALVSLSGSVTAAFFTAAATLTVVAVSTLIVARGH